MDTQHLIDIAKDFNIRDAADVELAQQLCEELEKLIADVEVIMNPIADDAREAVETAQADESTKVLLKHMIEAKTKSVHDRSELASKIFAERRALIVEKYRRKQLQRTADQKQELCDNLSAALAKKVIAMPEPADLAPQNAPASNDKPSEQSYLIPHLPVRLKNLAEYLIKAGGPVGSDDISIAIGYDPSRIYFDYQRPVLKQWIRDHIQHDGRGVYSWRKIASTKVQNKSVIVSK